MGLSVRSRTDMRTLAFFQPHPAGSERAVKNPDESRGLLRIAQPLSARSFSWGGPLRVHNRQHYDIAVFMNRQAVFIYFAFFKRNFRSANPASF
jgi:hypothetical protein